VCPCPGRAEAGEHLPCGQRGEVAEIQQAEPAQQIDQRRGAGGVERLDRQRGEKCGGSTRFDDLAASSGLFGGERAVGDADQDVRAA
jgi:hypothetical protein